MSKSRYTARLKRTRFGWLASMESNDWDEEDGYVGGIALDGGSLWRPTRGWLLRRVRWHVRFYNFLFDRGNRLAKVTDEHRLVVWESSER